jgi:hypothetical protein
MIIIKEIFSFLFKLFYRLRLLILYQFKLKPRIIKMKQFVNRIALIRKDLFPLGKSMFVFSGQDDTLYFIMLKEDSIISVLEVYDEILNKIPERYQILPQVKFSDLLTVS